MNDAGAAAPLLTGRHLHAGGFDPLLAERQRDVAAAIAGRLRLDPCCTNTLQARLASMDLAIDGWPLRDLRLCLSVVELQRTGDLTRELLRVPLRRL